MRPPSPRSTWAAVPHRGADDARRGARANDGGSADAIAFGRSAAPRRHPTRGSSRSGSWPAALVRTGEIVEGESPRLGDRLGLALPGPSAPPQAAGLTQRFTSCASGSNTMISLLNAGCSRAQPVACAWISSMGARRKQGMLRLGFVHSPVLKVPPEGPSDARNSPGGLRFGYKTGRDNRQDNAATFAPRTRAEPLCRSGGPDR